MIGQPIKTHLPSVAQLLISITGFVSLTGTALILWFAVLVGVSMQPLAEKSNGPLYSLIWVCLILALISIPSMILSIRRLARIPAKPARSLTLMLSTGILCLVTGPLVYLTHTRPEWLENPLIMAFLSVAAVAAPLWFFVELGRSRLKTGQSSKDVGTDQFYGFC